MKDQFLQLLIQIRAMQLFYHNAHHLVGRVCFWSDHLLLSDFYKEMDDNYDSVAERALGILEDNSVLILNTQLEQISEKVSSLPGVNATENSQFFRAGLELENELQQMCQEFASSLSGNLGLQNFISGIADDSQARCYKIKRRIM